MKVEVNTQKISLLGILGKVIDAVDRWCLEISGDAIEDCYSMYADIGLYETATIFSGWSYAGITDEDLEILRNIPDEEYNRLEELFHECIESILDTLKGTEE